MKTSGLALWVLLCCNTLMLQAQLNYLPQDSILFEYNTCQVNIDPSPDNIWMIGNPGKAYLDQAYSLPEAIITGTINPYPVSNTSSFSFVIDSNSTWNNPIGLATYISFIHKYDTDTLLDYGTIEASLDGGITWCDLNDPSCLSNFQPVWVWWEMDSSLSSHRVNIHPDRFSGRSDGWIFSRVHFDYAIGKKINQFRPDSILVKFIFHSDDIPSGKDGWLVDNIIAGACDIYVGSSGKPDIKKVITVIPDPLTDCSKLQFPETGFMYLDVLFYNSLGKPIRSMKIHSGEISYLYREDFSPGIYLISAKTVEGNAFHGKFIVK